MTQDLEMSGNIGITETGQIILTAKVNDQAFQFMITADEHIYTASLCRNKHLPDGNERIHGHNANLVCTFSNPDEACLKFNRMLKYLGIELSASARLDLPKAVRSGWKSPLETTRLIERAITEHLGG